MDWGGPRRKEPLDSELQEDGQAGLAGLAGRTTNCPPARWGGGEPGWGLGLGEDVTAKPGSYGETSD